MTSLYDAVARFCANGPEAISYIYRELRAEGWRNLGTLSDFERVVERLGFDVKEGRNNRNQRRTEVWGIER